MASDIFANCKHYVNPCLELVNGLSLRIKYQLNSERERRGNTLILSLPIYFVSFPDILDFLQLSKSLLNYSCMLSYFHMHLTGLSLLSTVPLSTHLHLSVLYEGLWKHLAFCVRDLDITDHLVLYGFQGSVLNI